MVFLWFSYVNSPERLDISKQGTWDGDAKSAEADVWSITVDSVDVSQGVNFSHSHLQAISKYIYIYTL